jgi:hypothetical protein
MTEEQLSALLRIKRFEQPPPQYFDRLLQDLHRRQRTELLHRPLWKIAAERVQTFFSEHSMGHLSYAGALASVLVVGVATIGLVTSGGGTTNGMASRAGKPAGLVAKTERPLITQSPDKLLSLQSQTGPVFDHTPLPDSQLRYEPMGREPRYIIDARPASYEPSTF